MRFVVSHCSFHRPFVFGYARNRADARSFDIPDVSRSLSVPPRNRERRNSPILFFPHIPPPTRNLSLFLSFPLFRHVLLRPMRVIPPLEIRRTYTIFVFCRLSDREHGRVSRRRSTSPAPETCSSRHTCVCVHVCTSNVRKREDRYVDRCGVRYTRRTCTGVHTRARCWPL